MAAFTGIRSDLNDLTRDPFIEIASLIHRIRNHMNVVPRNRMITGAFKPSDNGSTVDQQDEKAPNETVGILKFPLAILFLPLVRI